ncbi:cellulose biosynthesis cyclic di-GMP-binding regulatory protein BcsB [Viridibacillus sp. YIM B01967]|uniref:Cellulose biosynthesis cyclic di-GMP-binding regulatory protein BcsB n=1 Tax=Viridibacillus soli TaxID=2798301 RepID=A0ABS1H5E9_9BACL|nr:cellulose biosynthesis cyclic di-GMP-binding regulatory protein BcsB [Viridibacillus soli]MBK3494629.1 cellulose biosynthesis cyclic di-GMP-binding regulatory protein BcsB [Viridibacillus soli]
MKQFQLLIACLICIIIVAISPMKSEASTTISVKGLKMTAAEKTDYPQPITNTPITLNGPAGEVTFYYNLVSDVEGKSSNLVLNTENSELLIAPSSISVSIDNKMTKSIALNGDKPLRQMTIPLKGDALKEGTHAVTVKYYGVLKEGICVKQGTSANWLTLNINSYYQLNGLVKNSKMTLGDYPSKFVGSEDKSVYVVIPENASISTLNSALQIVSFLGNQSGKVSTVQIKRESDLNEINGNILFVGLASEFSNANIVRLWQDANIKQSANALNLAIRTLKQDKRQVSALFVTANTAADLEKRVSILTNLQFSNQLGGVDLSVKNLPKKQQTTQNGSATLKQFGVENLTLDSQGVNSSHYYYYAPVNTQLNKASTLSLKLKKSETITSLKEQVELKNDTNVELIVNVNNIPHSVNLRELADSKDGIYTVTVPIDAKAMKDNRLIDLQFQTTGLAVNDPCKSSDEKRWVYIDKESAFTFPVLQDNEAQTGYTFAAFPYPFINNDNTPMIVLPQKKDVPDEQLLNLYHALSKGNQQSNLQLKTADQVTVADVEEEDVIFIGGPNVQPLLQKKVNDLTISYKGEIAELSEEGFVSEAVEQFSWIQKNPWSKDNHSILVIDQQKDKPAYLDEELVNQLANSDEKATIIVQTSNKQFFTNADNVEANEYMNSKTKDSEGNQSISLWWIVAFAGLLLLIGILLWWIKRKK